MGENRRSPGYFESDERTPEQAYAQGKEDAQGDTLIDKWARASYEIPESIAGDSRSDQEKSYDAGVADADEESSWW